MTVFPDFFVFYLRQNQIHPDTIPVQIMVHNFLYQNFHKLWCSSSESPSRVGAMPLKTLSAPRTFSRV